jgi:TRAP-type C4-dicarboxylate transport system permease small subunit
LFGKDVPGLSGYEDVVRLAISAAALLFFPFCQLNRGHVAVDLFVRGFSYPIRRTLDRIWLVLICATAWFLAYWMVFGLLEKRSDHALAGVISWVEWPFYIPGILSLILWGCVALSQMFGETDDV